MCGIAGIVNFKNNTGNLKQKIEAAITCLNKRGPDGNGIYINKDIALGHTRLSIIDTSSDAAQPMHDIQKRYAIIFNGEFFNYQEHRDHLLKLGIQFSNHSDTEVLLNLYIREGKECLNKINGFFSIAIYDNEKETLFIARDRFGVKPLLYSFSDDELLFASEMKSLIALGVKKELNNVALYTYLQLNYIPGDISIFNSVKKLLPGQYIELHKINNEWKSKIGFYYQLDEKIKSIVPYKENYNVACSDFKKLMIDAVQKRLVSDVPIGAFLSGGIDSSVIATIAAQHVPKLDTFSIGFSDEPMYDETEYAKLVANKIGSRHTVFNVTNKDLYKHLFDVLDYIDEPFADSSALNVYLLSKLVRTKATVALSGDGADELFGGYNKHAAELKARSQSILNTSLKALSPLLKILPQSRNGKITNKLRQLNRYAQGLHLNAAERYWQWASISIEEDAAKILKNAVNSISEFKIYKKQFTNLIKDEGSLNDVFLADVKMVLPGDMLTKVDLMSMANSLEVRTPFLDYRIVEFAFSLSPEFKIDAQIRKKIVQDSFRDILPVELYNRKKQGFEVPLLHWFRNELNDLIKKDLLEDKFIASQNIFDSLEIKKLIAKMESSNPGESVGRMWALIVFQYWYKKYFIT